jgi:hypothetical protein
LIQSDEASAVLLVPFGDRKLQQVDLFPALDILQDRSALDSFRWKIAGQSFPLLGLPPQRLDQLGIAQIGRKSQQPGQTSRAAGGSGDYSITRRVIGDLVKQQAGTPTTIVDLGNGTQLLIPVGPFDVLEFPQLLGDPEPFTQILGLEPCRVLRTRFRFHDSWEEYRSQKIEDRRGKLTG